MATHDYQIVFTADTTQVIAGMNQVAGSFKQLEAMLNGTGSGMNQVTNQMREMTIKADGAAIALERAGQSGKSMGDHLMGLATSWIVIDAGTKALAAFGEMANKARDYAKEMAVETMGLRDQLRELANLKGHDGPDNEVLVETLNLGMKAGMLPEEARKYLEQFEGSSPAGEQKGNIDAKTKAELQVEGAKFGVRAKLAPQTAGDLAGVLSQYGQVKSAEEGAAKLDKIAWGLNQGRGNLEPLTRSLINTAGAVVGENAGFKSIEDLAAVVGVASTHANPREAGTRVRQATRALRDTEGPAKWMLRNANIKQSDTHIERLDKIAPMIAAAEKKGMGGDQYLKTQGFTDEDEIRAIVEQVHDLDIIHKRLDEQKKITGKGAMEKNERFLIRDRAGIKRRQDATKKAQEHVLGEKNERIQMAMDNAEQEMRDKGEIGGFANNAKEWAVDLGGLGPMLGLEKARDAKKYQRARVNLIGEAKKKGIGQDEIDQAFGIKVEKGTGVLGRANEAGERQDKMLGLSEEERKAGFNRLSTMVERKEGNAFGPGPNLAPKLDELVKESKETNRILAQRDAAKAAAQVPRPAGPPPLAPARAAAAPKRP